MFNAEQKEICSGKKFLGKATNNVAEYTALLLGLEAALAEGVTDITCRLDSELIVKQMNGQYRVKNPDMKVFFDKVRSCAARFQSVTFEHVRREQNKRADRLANEAMDEGMRGVRS